MPWAGGIAPGLGQRACGQPSRTGQPCGRCAHRVSRPPLQFAARKHEPVRCRHRRRRLWRLGGVFPLRQIHGRDSQVGFETSTRWRQEPLHHTVRLAAAVAAEPAAFERAVFLQQQGSSQGLREMSALRSAGWGEAANERSPCCSRAAEKCQGQHALLFRLWLGIHLDQSCVS